MKNLWKQKFINIISGTTTQSPSHLLLSICVQQVGVTSYNKTQNQ